MRNPYAYVITCLLAFVLAACGDATQGSATDVSGNWSGQLNSGIVPIPFTMLLNQRGKTLTGSIALAGSPALPISGEVDNNRVTLASGYQEANLQILGTVTGATMTGTMTLNLAGQPMAGDFTATK